MTEYLPMIPRIKELWVAEMEREDLYPTFGKGFLCHRERAVDLNVPGLDLYDPLGILCEVAVRHDVIQPGRWCGESPEDRPEFLRFKRYHGEQGLLPKEVAGWAGLPSQNPAVLLSADERRMLQLPLRYRPGGKIGARDRRVPLVVISDHSRATREMIIDMIETL